MLGKPDAVANIIGSNLYPSIKGKANFYTIEYGVMVAIEVNGLQTNDNRCSGLIYGIHIHDGESCTGDKKDMFSNAMSHFNPDNCDHPYHAGDMPPLFENKGHAFMMFLTDRFEVNDIIGKTIIIHDKPDDFTTQPSGNSGNKIACRVINKN